MSSNQKAEDWKREQISSAVKAAFDGAFGGYGKLESLSFTAGPDGIHITLSGIPKGKEEEEGEDNVVEKTHFYPIPEEALKPDENEFCEWCGQDECVSKRLYNGFVETGEELEEEGLTNKEIQFQLYQQATYELHGHLGQGNRKELPDCVYADIHDLYHDKEYVGFKNA